MNERLNTFHVPLQTLQEVEKLCVLVFSLNQLPDKLGQEIQVVRIHVVVNIITLAHLPSNNINNASHL
jgi:hypothetical protein